MNAIVSGSGTGLLKTSLYTLGPSGRIGQAEYGAAREAAYVNISNGNLVLQRQDELLVSCGTDVGVLRTYNSQGLTDGDNNDNWRIGFYRQIRSLTGTINAVSSTVARIDADGSQSIYTYDVSVAKYLSTDGDGSYDTLTYNSTTRTWTWVDGSSGIKEAYDWENNAGKLLFQSDADGNTTGYSYNGALLSRVTSASSSTSNVNYIDLVYDTAAGKTSNLLSVRTSTWDSASNMTRSLTRVSYGYETYGTSQSRLKTVVVDLTPENSSDSRTYTTTYAYVDTTGRLVSGISQSDGSSLAITYSGNRIASIADALGNRTSFSYDTTNRMTTVTDALGNATTYQYDSVGQLLNTTGPAVNGVTASTSYSYSSRGDLLAVTDGLGNRTTYTYDSSGNRLTKTDALGIVTTWAYNSNNQVLTETANAMPGSPVIRYVYDAGGKNRLRFVIDALGQVTEYQYNSIGQQTACIRYASANLYAGTSAATESALSTWVGTIADKSGATRTDMSYDFRGQLASSTTYAKVNSSGNGTIDGTEIKTSFVYDQAGQLLQTIAPRSSTDKTQYAYDGLGRVISKVDALGYTTSTSYSDATRTDTRTDGSGSVTRQIYDAGNQLIFTVDPTGSVVKYDYDANGNMTKRTAYANTIAAGAAPSTVVADSGRDQVSRNVYDANNRLAWSIDALNIATDYDYDANGNLVRKTERALPVSRAFDVTVAQQMSATADLETYGLRYSGTLTVPVSGSYTFSISGDDCVRFYLGEILPASPTIAPAQGASGSAVISLVAGRTYQFFQTFAEISGAQSMELKVTTGPGGSTANNFGVNFSPMRVEILDFGAGSSLSWADATGLTPTSNGKASKVADGIALFDFSDASYARLANKSFLGPASGVGGSNPDRVSRNVYDADNRLIYAVDALGAVVKYDYDANDNVVQRTAYANTIGAGAAPSTVAADMARDQVSRNVYDADNRLIHTLDAMGAVVRYDYDANDNVVQVTAYVNALDRIAVNSELKAGQSLFSGNGRFELAMQSDGNLVIYEYRPGGSRVALWVMTPMSGQAQKAGSVLKFQADGNLVLYSPDGVAIWSPNIQGKGAQSLVMQDDGRLVAYDANGAVVWNNSATGQPVASDQPSRVSSVRTDASRDRASRNVYDANNRLVYTVDPTGAVVKYDYDANDNLVKKTAYSNTIGASAAPSAVVASSTLDQVSRNVYDANNRLTHTVDPTGAVVRYDYDINGNVVQTTAYASTIGASALPSAVPTDTARDQVVRNVYDANGRLIYTVDAMGAVTKQDYDAFGNRIRQTAYATAIGGAAAAASVVTSTGDRITRYQYDAANRQVRTIYPTVGVYTVETIAALGSNGSNGAARRVETQSTLETQALYDVFGNIVANRDTAGNMRYQAYDLLGRLQYAVDAEGFVTAYERDYAGNVTRLTRYADKIDDATRSAWESSAPSAAAIATRLASSSANRVMTTTYDALGRAVRIVEPSVYAYDGSSGFNASPETRIAYNAFGQVIQTSMLQRESNWLVTTRYYDRRGLETMGIDALGYATEQTYDAFGNATLRTEYATALAANSWSASVAGVPVTSGDDRAIRTTYDLANRKLSETRLQVEVADTDSAPVTLTGTINGVAVNRSLGAGAYTMGSMLIDNDTLTFLRVKPGWIVTLYEDDNFQGIMQQYKVDESAIANTFTLGANLSRKVSSLVIAPNRSVRADLLTQYAYDAFGNLLNTTDAGGNITRNYYDRANRVSAVLTPGKRGIDIASAQWVTEFTRDVFGNATAQKQYANAASIVGGSYTVSASTDDRSTTAKFDAWGRVVESSDALGNTQYFSWDAGGRLVKQWQGVTVSGAQQTLYKRFGYDKLGRLLSIEEPFPSLAGAFFPMKTQMAYNGFGEMTRKGVEGVGDSWSEAFDYDNGGRVWRTNSGDGVWKVQLYDLQGNLSADIRSAQGLSALTSASAADALTTTRRVNSSYDGLGRMTSQKQANGGMVYQTWDRWGNRISVSDPRNASWKTDYLYDANNQVVRETRPTVKVLNNGAAGADADYVDLRPETRYFYDHAGRPVAVRDARGNVNGKFYDPAGKVLVDWNADGGTSRHEYDGFGNETRRWDALNNLTSYSYDKLNRLIATERAGASFSSPVTETGMVVTLYENSGYNAQSGNSQSYGLGTHIIDEIYAATSSLKVAPGFRATLYENADRTGRSQTYSADATYVGDTMNDLASCLVVEGTAVTLFENAGQQGKSASYGTGVYYLEDSSFNDIASSLKVAPGFKVILYEHIDKTGKSKSYTFTDTDDLSTFMNDQASVLVVERDAGYWPGQWNTAVRTQFLTTYDELGRKVSTTNANGEKTSYSHDLRGNVIRVDDASGKSTRYWYDALGRKSQEITANVTQTWDYDYFGRLNSWADFGGVSNTYAYDNLGQLTSESNTRGRNIAYSYDTSGQLTKIDDKTAGRVSDYGYDLRGNRTSEKVTTGGTVYQNQLLKYDSWGRLTSVVDLLDNPGSITTAAPEGTDNDIQYAYDTVGNRARETRSLGDVKGVKKYYAYDAMNRQILVDGANNNNADFDQNLNLSQGVRVRYDRNGNRIEEKTVRSIERYLASLSWRDNIQQTSYINFLLFSTKSFSYDSLGKLITVSQTDDEWNGTTSTAVTPAYTQYTPKTVTKKVVYTESRLYDKADRLTYLNENGRITWNAYDNAGRLFYSEKGTAQTTYRYDSTGQLKHSLERKDVGVANARGYFHTAATVYTYKAGAGNYQQDTVGLSRVRSDNTANVESETSTSVYDANRYLTGVDVSKTGSNYSRSFIVDANGQILQKKQGDSILRNLVVNGQVLASYGKGQDPTRPYNTDETVNFIDINETDIAFQKIDSAYPLATPGSYQVRAGDSLQSIAQAFFGDASMWYVIADANGLQSDAGLFAGMALSIPNRVGTVSNNAGTYKPFDMGRLIGPNAPYVSMPKAPPPPPPPQASNNQCAQTGIMIATVLAAVVVSMITAGIATAVIGPMLSAVGGGGAAVVIGAVGGAALGGFTGSLASQGVTIAAGQQTAINWVDAGIDAAIGAATFVASAAMGPVGSIAGKVAATGAKFASKLVQVTMRSAQVAETAIQSVQKAGVLAARVVANSAQYAAVNVVNDAIAQGIRINTGRQDSFNWRSTTAAAVSGAVSGAAGVAGRAGSMRSFGAGVTADLAGGVGANFLLNDGVFDPTQFAADSVATLRGNIGARLSYAGVARESPDACFVAGTLVHTSEGLKPIESFVGGEMVLARDEASGELAYRRVLGTRVTPCQAILRVEAWSPDGRHEMLRTTAEHPFRVKDHGWKAAHLLQAGDVLIDCEDQPLAVESLVQEEVFETVYNIEVEEFHTYHVGVAGIWVHNTCGRKRSANEMLGADDARPSRSNGPRSGPGKGKVVGKLSEDGKQFFGPITFREHEYLNRRAQTVLDGNNRPHYAPGQVKIVWGNAPRSPISGAVRDPNTNRQLSWNGTSRKGMWDMGHLPGKEYRSLKEGLRTGEIHPEFFFREYFNPENYQPEGINENRSHRFEATTNLHKQN
ncbi:MAG TPA: polymorphic toxin-type HINT domain-containing protein [Noviherbaspirillum sp.]